MSETVTLSKSDLDALVAAAARGGTPAAEMAAPAPTPEPDLTIGDVLRVLVQHAKLPTEGQVRACLAAIDTAYPPEGSIGGVSEKSDSE